MNRDELYDKFISWWNELQNNTGGRARLRRCASPEEAVILPEVHSLYVGLPKWISLEAVAVLAGVSANIKTNSSMPFAKSLASPRENKGRAPFSESRFRQLLSCRDWDELYTKLRRAVVILDGNVNLSDFFKTILEWQDEFKNAYKKPGNSLKYKLSKEYYETVINYESNSK